MFLADNSGKWSVGEVIWGKEYNVCASRLLRLAPNYSDSDQ